MFLLDISSFRISLLACSLFSAFFPSQHLYLQLLLQDGAIVPSNIISKAKTTPHPTMSGPISLSPRVLNPFSPRAIHVTTRPNPPSPALYREVNVDLQRVSIARILNARWTLLVLPALDFLSCKVLRTSSLDKHYVNICIAGTSLEI